MLIVRVLRDEVYLAFRAPGENYDLFGPDARHFDQFGNVICLQDVFAGEVDN